MGAGNVETPLRFSLIVPARHEQAVLGVTLDRLAELDYPCFEVLAVVGHDDTGTKEVAVAAAARHPHRIRVITDHSWPKNKPSALNTALAECRSDVVGVFDAEDEVHPRLLRQVAGAFGRSGAHVVQGGVQLVNFQSSWYALRNCLEYFFWFRSASAPARRAALHPARRQHRLHRGPTSCQRSVAGTSSAWPRTASSASGCRASAPGSTSPTTPSGDQGGDSRTPCAGC